MQARSQPIAPGEVREASESSPRASTPAASTEGTIELRNVSKSFMTNHGELPVLQDLSFRVEAGECVAVVGPSGSGKTTLLNLLAGLDQPTSGEILVSGRPIRGPSPERGVIFQQYAVFPYLTVYQNVLFGLTLRANKKPRAERKRLVKRYIDLVGLQGFENAYPKTLSGGMKQRLAIARAYAVNPKILFMDEPFAALDAQTRELMQELILEIMAEEKKTIIFVTHSVEEAIFVGNRIVSVTARPATLHEVVDVPFGYPRTADVRTSQEFTAIRRHVEQQVRAQYASARAAVTGKG
ncbi:MAG: ABC transporter ATP-binding protein [Trueperaceae bacterium]